VRQFVAAAAVLIFAALLAGQNPPQPMGSATQRSADPQFQRNRNQRSPLEEEWERKRLKALNEERQQSLKRDTDELLKLATELKEYVDKTNENILSVDVIEKAEEIEKLAKKVRNKMKDSPILPVAQRP
jgi:hypothetical protein